MIASAEPPLSPFLWKWLAHDHQYPDEDGDWTTWLLIGGRGAGKTRAGAEWIRSRAERAPGARPPRFALIAETYADAREIMIEGPSGLRAIAPAIARPDFEASRRRLVWPLTGAVAYCFSAEDPDGLRGHQFDAAWSDELCKWRYPEETWSNLQLALRLGAQPRQVATTTPRPLALLKRLMAAPTTRVARATTYDNRAHLPAAFFSEIAAAYEGTALGRQELLGEIVEDRAGALWTWEMIEAARIARAPEPERIVVAVDPPASASGAACGIVVAARTGESAYVLADWSVAGLSPRGWAQRAAAACQEFGADRLLVEANQGGDMARDVLLAVDRALPVRAVHASRSKRLRAEPVAALYEQGRVRHVGAFSRLEDEMTNFTGSPGEASPDRLDALVWAVSDLLLARSSPSPSIRIPH